MYLIMISTIDCNHISPMSISVGTLIYNNIKDQNIFIINSLIRNYFYICIDYLINYDGNGTYIQNWRTAVAPYK